MLADLHSQRHAVRVEALQRGVDPAEARLTFQLWTQRFQRRLVRYAPGHTAQRIAGFKSRRQVGGLQRVKLNARAAEGGEHAASGVASQAKIVHKFGAMVQVIYAKFQLFNSGNTHFSSPLYRSVARIWA